MKTSLRKLRLSVNCRVSLQQISITGFHINSIVISFRAGTIFSNHSNDMLSPESIDLVTVTSISSFEGLIMRKIRRADFEIGTSSNNTTDLPEKGDITTPIALITPNHRLKLIMFVLFLQMIKPKSLLATANHKKGKIKKIFNGGQGVSNFPNAPETLFSTGMEKKIHHLSSRKSLKP
uniref:Uncharacterized protein n=1 Tax=Glossina brevipalpis TaxID=37001 RepID=A0A1A9W4G3_9MUSC